MLKIMISGCNGHMGQVMSRLCAEKGELLTTAELSSRTPAAHPPGPVGTGRELFAFMRMGADEAEKGGSAMLAAMEAVV